MVASATPAIVGLVFGAGFLAVALASTLSKVTLSAFNPCLLRQIRFSEHPKTFLALVTMYWLVGLAGVVAGIAGMLGGFQQ